ncbi:MAG: conjugal transfer protein TraX [Defluviitaleaceae bacterium]|nr:conjugal transfer protein TraX [Defluviitaleaceae bacterium]
MTNFQIKLIAIITMLIDHIGHALWDGQPEMSLPFVMRIIGRIAFPLFAFLIAEGCMHTKNMKAYMIRLGMFAIISQWFFATFLQVGLLQNLNIFFTLLLGTFVIYCFNGVKTKTWPHLILFIAMFIVIFIYAFELNIDFGGFGVLLIVLLYLAKGATHKKMFTALAAISVLAILYPPLDPSFGLPLFVGSLFSILPMVLYNGKRGWNKLKWLFYVFYPAHMLVIVLVR